MEDLFKEQLFSENTVMLNVVKSQFISSEQMTWQQMFCGFTHIDAVTFSSSLEMINELLENFKTATIILGNEAIVHPDLTAIMALNQTVLDELKANFKKYGRILEMIKEGSLELKIYQKGLSHEKIYIMSNEDKSKTRVITGSANLSKNAFYNYQREQFDLKDDIDAFNYFSAYYNDLELDCNDKITLDKIKPQTETKIDDHTYIHKVKTNCLVVEESDANESEVRFIADYQRNVEKYKPVVEQAIKKTIVRITYDEITEIKRQLQQKQEEERQYLKNPDLTYDLELKRIFFNGQELNLEPQKEQIKNDCQLLLQYYQGIENNFVGRIFELQKNYYKFLVWFLCSPFIQKFRLTADQNKKSQFMYPMVAIIYGKSNAGKTTYIELLYKMAFGISKGFLIDGKDFTRTEVNALQETVLGCPLTYDDVSRKRFADHGEETLKSTDRLGFKNRKETYPCLILSSNKDVRSFPLEMRKRSILCLTEACAKDNQQIYTNEDKRITSEISTAFVHEYWKRMLQRMPDLLDGLQTASEEINEIDLLKLSSQTVNEILKENVETLPAFANVVTIEDYVNPKYFNHELIENIQSLWKEKAKSLVVNEKRNELIYDVIDSYKARELIQQLPQILEASNYDYGRIKMRLDKAREFFELDFKEHIFGGRS